MPVITNPSLATTMADTTPLQDVFDTCAVHLLKQGRRSEDDGACLYRGPDGTSCPVGCLIADNEYQGAMENKTSTRLIEYGGYNLPVGATAAARNLWSNKVRLLAWMQAVHDSNSPEVWLNQLYRVAFMDPESPLDTAALTPFGPPPGDVALLMTSGAKRPFKTPAGAA